MDNARLDEGWNSKPGHRVYGFRLRPFCLYYQHLLQSIGSPLVKAGTTYEIKDLFIAAEICSSAWSEEGYTLDRILTPGFLRRKRNQLRMLTENPARQIDRWNEYSQDFLSFAEKWEQDTKEYDEFGGVVREHKKFGRTDLDVVMAKATRVMMAFAWSEEKVMMMPIGRLYGYDDYIGIFQGEKTQFVAGPELEAIERDKAQRLMEEGLAAAKTKKGKKK